MGSSTSAEGGSSGKQSLNLAASPESLSTAQPEQDADDDLTRDVASSKKSIEKQNSSRIRLHQISMNRPQSKKPFKAASSFSFMVSNSVTA